MAAASKPSQQAHYSSYVQVGTVWSPGAGLPPPPLATLADGAPAAAQVIVPDSAHTAPSVLLVFDKERYLFNAGEGLQRIFCQHRLRVSKASLRTLPRPVDA